MSETAKKIVSKECRFAVHCDTKTTFDDIHLVKEIIHYEDGTSEPNVLLIPNFKRPFYITKKGCRNYNDFKEWEDIDKLDKFLCRQTELADSVAKALNKPWARGGLRELCSSPYVYGVDISSTSIIKHHYQTKWDTVTPYTYASFDTETDMVHGHGDIMMASITYKERVYTAVQKSFLVGWALPVERILKLCDEYLAKEIKDRNLKIEIEVVDNEIDCVKKCIDKAHEWKPDIVGVWNISFDMDKIIRACDKAGIDPKDILSDPKIPPEYRHFKFKPGAAKKVTASGRIINFKPSQRWSVVDVPSSFAWIDAMQAYRQVRQGAPEEPSYGLNAILEKHKLKGKLKFKELEGTKIPDDGAEWHRIMQSQFPLHYVVYNIFDCIGMELLDEKTLDLQLSMPMFAGCTDFANFNSLPKKTINELHWFCLEKNKIMGSTASEMTTDLDSETTDVKGWIVMLPSHPVEDNGLKVILENSDLRTNIRVYVADLDVAGAYPHNELVFNVSKETTSKELVEVVGFDEQLVRMQTINFSGGPTNAIEFCTTLYGMPQLDELLKHYDEHQEVINV